MTSSQIAVTCTLRHLAFATLALTTGCREPLTQSGATASTDGDEISLDLYAPEGTTIQVRDKSVVCSLVCPRIKLPAASFPAGKSSLAVTFLRGGKRFEASVAIERVARPPETALDYRTNEKPGLYMSCALSNKGSFGGPSSYFPVVDFREATVSFSGKDGDSVSLAGEVKSVAGGTTSFVLTPDKIARRLVAKSAGAERRFVLREKVVLKSADGVEQDESLECDELGGLLYQTMSLKLQSGGMILSGETGGGQSQKSVLLFRDRKLVVVGPATKLEEVSHAALVDERARAVRQCGTYERAGTTVRFSFEEVDHTIRVYERRTGKLTATRSFTGPSGLSCPTVITAAVADKWSTHGPDPAVENAWLATLL